MPTSDLASAKIGAKIDLIAKRIGESLKAHGFARKGRLMHRTIGEGVDTCQQSVELQGEKWNAGTTGRFAVNLGVHFPALEAAISPNPHGAETDSPSELAHPAMGAARIFERLGGVVPESVEPRWPVGLKKGVDYWASLDAGTDPMQLADSIAKVLEAHALPWFEERASLGAACTLDRGLRPRDAVIGLLITGDARGALGALTSKPPHRFAQGAEDWHRFVAQLRALGLEGDAPAWQDPPAHSMKARRKDEVTQLVAQHEAEVERFLAQTGADWQHDMDRLLDTWIHAVAAEQGTEGAKGGRLWRLVAQAPVASRRRLVVRALERCKDDGPTVRSTIADVWADYRDFHLTAFSALVRQLLDFDDAGIDPAHLKALLHSLAACAGRVKEDIAADHFQAPFSTVIRWIARRAPADCRHASRGDIVELVSEVTRLTVARYLERTQTPPPADLLGPELAAQLAELYTPAARERMAALYREFPERAYAAEDREAVIELKRWTRADPDGRVPLLIEGDDWGKALSEALESTPEPLRTALPTLLEWFDNGVEPRPSKRWTSELQRQLADFDREALVGWLARTLPRFADTRLEHVAATPGIGAFPGTTSGRLALGLVHVAVLIDSPRLVEPLYALTEAALAVVPGQRMRAQSLATAAFEPLARSAEGREKLAVLMRKVKQKPVIASIRKALESAR